MSIKLIQRDFQTCAGDVIIAATAIENNITLVSCNAKHFKAVKELLLKTFKP